jgi:16S rRNA (cytosine967-C5)-methyltransferase
MTFPSPNEIRNSGPAAPQTARGVAAEILGRWLTDGDFPNRRLESVIRDRPFIMEVVLGSVRRYGSLRWVLDERCNLAPEPPVVACFLAGAYELLFMDRVQVHAAVFETVEAAKGLVRPEAVSFLNAVLRRVSVERDSILAALARQPDPIRLSHPPQLVHRWNKAFGETHMRRLCEWNNSRPFIGLHPFRLRTTLTAYRARLAEHGVAAEPHPFAPDTFLSVETLRQPVEDLPGYADGEFTIQDPATSLAVDLLAPKPGERILDACASPGGKTVLIAERMNGRGEVVALEVHEDRMGRLRDTIGRLALRGVRPFQADAARLSPALLRDLGLAGDGFDGILLDVPCSNTGVIRRRPDVRWRLDAALFARLKRTQFALLDSASKMVNPGGRLVYSTCSLETDENEGLIGEWLRRNPQFRMERALKSFPPESKCDGAYAVKLRREAGRPAP